MENIVKCRPAHRFIVMPRNLHSEVLLHSMGAWLNIVTMLFSPECAGWNKFKTHWLLRVAGLPCLLIVLALLFTVFVPGSNTGCFNARLRKSLFFVIFFTYPTVCKEVFATFNRISLETAVDSSLKNQSVLASDDRVFCGDIFVWRLFSALIIAAVGFGVGPWKSISN